MDPGSWINRNDKRAKYGDDIKKKFTERDEENFRLKFFGARKFAENNYEAVTGTLNSAFSGLFKEVEDNCYFVGVVEEDGMVRKYEVIEKDARGRLVCNETVEKLNLCSLVPLGVLDMNQVNSPTSRFVNINKFGIIMLLKKLNISLIC
jgi:hypothetical protein